MGSAIISLAVTVFVFGAFLRILAPSASRRVVGWFPRGDRGVDRSIIGQTERRGAVLAALAAASLAEAGATGTGDGSGLLLFGVFAAVLFRMAEGPVGVFLGVLGTIAAFQGVFEPTCTDLNGSRSQLAVVLAVGGLVLFGVLRFMFGGIGLALGSAKGVALCAFGIVSLSVFVAGPFGVDLTEVVGLGGGLTAVVGVFALIVVGAALLPAYSASIIGLALLAATISYDVVVEGCNPPATLPVVFGFVLVWWLAGRFTSSGRAS